MSTSDLDRTSPVSSGQLAGPWPTHPVASSVGLDWRAVFLRRFQHPPCLISRPEVRDHSLVVHLRGPVMIEEHTNTGRQERRWSDRGQMSLNPAGTPLSRTVHGRSDVLLIHIAPELIREATEEICDGNSSDVFLVSRLAVPDETVFQIGNLLLKEAECGARGSGLVANSLARVLAVHLVREHSNVTLRLPETPATLAGVHLRRVMDHMRSHLNETQSLAHLAGLCGLSPSHFSRAFAKPLAFRRIATPCSCGWIWHVIYLRRPTYRSSKSLYDVVRTTDAFCNDVS